MKENLEIKQPGVFKLWAGDSNVSVGDPAESWEEEGKSHLLLLSPRKGSGVGWGRNRQEAVMCLKVTGVSEVAL